MHAVIRTGGKQYYVTAGDILEVEKLAGEVGDIITLDDILMVANDEDVTVGQPTVAEAAITARITGQYRGTKIIVFRYRPKKRIRVRKGHRQYITRLEIQSVKLGEHEFTVPAAVQRPAIVAPAIVEPVVEPQVAAVTEPVIEESSVVEETSPVEPIAEETIAEETITEETATEETMPAENVDTTVDASTVDADEDSAKKA